MFFFFVKVKLIKNKRSQQNMTSTIWTEKYRPSTFEEIKGQKEIIEKVKAFVETQNMPHLLFSGPAGIGKTTLALVIAKQLYGGEWRQNVLELNASDERGIDVVRVKVKDFARTKAIGKVPFKLIYLDESDALTREAQQALRRTMENYTTTCRFILSANYSSKIIDPIQSRCAIFRFKPLAEEDINKIIDGIVKEESLTISKEAKKALFNVCEGDARRLENILQCCAVIKKNIDAEMVYSMASVAKPKEINQVLMLAASGNFLESRSKLLGLMLDYGMAGLDVIKQIQKEIWNLKITDRQKVELVDKCGEVEFRMVEGADEYVQLESFLAFVTLVGTR